MDATLAYLGYLTLALLVKYKVVYIKFIDNILEYLNLNDYILMYLILIFMSYLIGIRYANRIFKKSAMKSYWEEV